MPGVGESGHHRVADMYAAVLRPGEGRQDVVRIGLPIMTVEPDLSRAVVLVVHAHPDDEVFATGAVRCS